MQWQAGSTPGRSSNGGEAVRVMPEDHSIRVWYSELNKECMLRSSFDEEGKSGNHKAARGATTAQQALVASCLLGEM